MRGNGCQHLEQEEEEEQEAEVVAAEQVELPHRAEARQQQRRQRTLDMRVWRQDLQPVPIICTSSAQTGTFVSLFGGWGPRPRSEDAGK